MTRDNADRLALFTDNNPYIEVQRIALNRDQIDHYNPPPNPAKVTDSRSKEYIKAHGETSWELDALEPSVIEQLIQSMIDSHLDHDLWDEVYQEQEESRAKLRHLSDHWPEVENFLETLR